MTTQIKAITSNEITEEIVITLAMERCRGGGGRTGGYTCVVSLGSCPLSAKQAVMGERNFRDAAGYIGIALMHLSGWEWIAVVTDTDWVRHSINFFRFLVPGQIRIFPTREAAEARRYILADI